MFTNHTYRSLVRPNVLSILTILICLCAISTASTVLAVEYKSGVLRFKAEYSDVFLPRAITEVFFDTTSCPKDTFTTSGLSGLRIDRVTFEGASTKVTDLRQLEGIVIRIPEMARCIVEQKILSLKRRIELSVPYDTVGWNWKRETYFFKPDLSKHFELYFQDESSSDSILESMKSIPQLGNVGRISVGEADGICDLIGGSEDPESSWDLSERQQNNVGGVNSETAWRLLDDHGTYGLQNIAFIDLGANMDHPDLVTKYCECGDASVATGSGHGTPTVGIAAAVTCNGIGRKGQAPDAGIWPYNYNDGDTDHLDDLYRAIEVDLADLINFAYPEPDSDNNLFELCVTAKGYDIPIIATAGNISGSVLPYTAKVQFPGQWTNLTIAVGAYLPNGDVNPRSNYGCPTCTPPVRDFIDVVAPGHYLWTTAQNGGYDWFSGTSAAAPVVSGIVALGLDYSPDLTVDRIQEWLRSTADKDGNYDTLHYGGGRADAFRFVFQTVNLSAPESPYIVRHPDKRDLRNAAYRFTNQKIEERESALDVQRDWAPLSPDRSYGVLLDTTHNLELYPAGSNRNVPKTCLQGNSTDSIPCVIITSNSLAPYWENFASEKTRAGTRTQIITEGTYQHYYGFDAQDKIRSFLKDYATNNHLRWVILGGDQSSVPFRIVRSDLRGTGQEFVSDYYYACLDGNWDADADQIYGEINDDVDLVPELAVGRIPASSSAQVLAFVEKLHSYRTVDESLWQLRALALGSQMFYAGDGPERCQELLSLLPSEFETTALYDGDSGIASLQNYSQAMNLGQGLVLCNGLAQHEQNYFLRRQGGSVLLTNTDVDALANHGRPAIVYSSTCWNNMMEMDCISEHYMNHATGGAVAYIGSSYNDFPYATQGMATVFLESMLADQPASIGELLNEARTTLLAESSSENGARHSMLSFNLLGDPSMSIWTAVPKQFTVSKPDWLPWGVGTQSFDVTVTDSGSAVEGAVVCLQYGTAIYSVQTTGSDGVAHFTSVSVPNNSTGEATVVVTKANYVTNESVMHLTWCGTPGDANYNCAVTIADAVFIVNYIFNSGPAPVVLNRADPNGTGSINISDQVYLTNYIFNGGPAPVFGQVTLPPGGKIYQASGDPNDVESIPDGLEVTSEISLTVEKAGPNARTITLNSTRTIYGLSVTLTAAPDTKVNVVSLLTGDEAADLYWSQTGSLVKIGLADVNGKKYFKPGIRQILQITGDFEIAYVLAADRGEGATTITLRPSFTNLEKAPSDFSFEPNYPNPFNPSTSLSFSLPRQAKVSLDIYNVLGQRVRTVVDGVLPAGRHSVEWDGTDQSGHSVASGMYFARFSAGEFRASRKMLIVK